MSPGSRPTSGTRPPIASSTPTPAVTSPIATRTRPSGAISTRQLSHSLVLPQRHEEHAVVVRGGKPAAIAIRREDEEFAGRELEYVAQTPIGVDEQLLLEGD